jgi:hypothetical protein
MTSTILSENESVIVGHNDWRSIWSYRAVFVPLDAFPKAFGTSVGTPPWNLRDVTQCSPRVMTMSSPPRMIL